MKIRDFIKTRQSIVSAKIIGFYRKQKFVTLVLELSILVQIFRICWLRHLKSTLSKQNFNNCNISNGILITAIFHFQFFDSFGKGLLKSNKWMTPFPSFAIPLSTFQFLKHLWFRFRTFFTFKYTWHCT